MENSHQALLKTISFGARIAEEETTKLASYFVETDQWNRIFNGEIDVIYGAKGSGKSAIYSLLTDKQNELLDRSVIAVTAENPRGTPAFKDLVLDPPLSENEFTFLWKLYFLSLIGKAFQEYGIDNEYAIEIQTSLIAAGLLPHEFSLRQAIRTALDYARNLLKFEAIEGTVKLDPNTGLPNGVAGKITFSEPNTHLKKAGFLSVDDLLEKSNQALVLYGYSIWILLDRLDVAFAESDELEQRALKALFKVYLDLVPYENLSLKIFLRTDIWNRITTEGFREASHITRHVTITWNTTSLLNLVIKRALGNVELVKHYGILPISVLANVDQQDEFFYRMFPDRVDSGEKKPVTFDWLLSRSCDGSGSTAPRELIHLLNCTRQEESKISEGGGEPFPAGRLFSANALKSALPEVSRTRLFQTLTAEYPETRDWVLALKEGKTLHTVSTLASNWRVNNETAEVRAAKLLEVGFFERRGTREAPQFWVPFLYRDALEMVQGSAE